MSLRSMTGFGQANVEDVGLSLSIEIKSVNHRFLDVLPRLPALYSSFEFELVKKARERLGRGRVEIFVSRTEMTQSAGEVRFDEKIFQDYIAAVEKVSALLDKKVRDAVRVEALKGALLRREVLDYVSTEADLSSEKEQLFSVLDTAIDDLIRMREEEGRALSAEMHRLISSLDTIVSQIRSLASSTVENQRDRLTERISKIFQGKEIDEDRLAQEVAYFADRVDVTEELTRLQSHMNQFRALLDGDVSGKKLEFLLQEMSREMNTVGSKAQHADISSQVVEGKALLEKLREQVLNIE